MRAAGPVKKRPLAVPTNLDQVSRLMRIAIASVDYVECRRR